MKINSIDEDELYRMLQAGSNASGGFLPLQNLWLPRPLHRRVQHGSWCQTEAPGPLLERPRHQASVCTAQRLLRLRIGATEGRTPAFSVVTPAAADASRRPASRSISWDVVTVAVSLCPAASTHTNTETTQHT